MSCCVTARKRVVLNVAVQIESLRILQIGVRNWIKVVLQSGLMNRPILEL